MTQQALASEWSEPSGAVRVSLWRKVATEIWTHLPAWLFFMYGSLLLNTLLTNLTPAPKELAFTAAFPIGVFLSYYGVRAWRAPDVRRRWLLFGIAASLSLVVPFVTFTWHAPSPLTAEELRLFYEISNFAWALLLIVHAVRTRPDHGLLFFGAGLFYGAMLENGGILLGYFAETHLLTMVPPFVAPLSTMVGWSVVLYMSFFIARGLRSWLPGLRRSAVLSSIVVATSAVLLDLQIDPIATHVGCWVWDPSLPPVLGPVPLVNFIAWVCALLPFAYVMFRYQEINGLSDETRLSRRHHVMAFAASPAILLLAAAAFLALITLIEGVSGPSWMVLYRCFSMVQAPL